MNRTKSIPMPPQVGWTVEIPIIDQIRRCTWDREHGLTIEELSGEEANTLVKGLFAAALATYQNQNKKADPPAVPPVAVNGEVDGAEVANAFNIGTRSGRLDSSKPNEANTPKSHQEATEISSEIGPEPSPAASDPPGVTQRRRVNWSRRKNLDGKTIKDIKEMTNGGAAILFEDGSGCSADEYGNIVSRQQGDMAVMAAQGESNPPSEETKQIPVETDTETQQPLPLAETTPTEPVKLVSEPETVKEPEPVNETEPEVTVAADPSSTLDAEGLGLTDDMLLSVSQSISHLYRVKKITRLSELVQICESLREHSPAFSRIKDMKKRMRSACMALELDCT